MSNREVKASRLIEVLLALSALVIIVCMIYIARPSPSRSDSIPAVSDSPGLIPEPVRLKTIWKVELQRPKTVEPGRVAMARLPEPITNDPAERSPLADGLDAKAGSGMRDLAIVLNVFEHYRDQFEGFPAGEDNQTMVNALTGNNPGRIAFLPPDHPAINAAGELVDRWGSPFYFHSISHKELEIRSAGPDQKLYTNDDQVLSPRQGAVLTLARGDDADAG